MPRPAVESQKLAALAGFWSAAAAVVLGLAYMLVLVILAFIPNSYPPPEPYRSIIGLIVILTAVDLVILFTAVHFSTSPRWSLLSFLAVIFTALFGAMTTVNRFVGMTVVKQGLAAGMGAQLDLVQPYGWPSVMLALEILGWGFFLGLALLCAGFTFSGGRLETWMRWTLLACGVLCLVPAVGFMLGNTNLNWFGVAAWGPGLTLFCALAAVFFRRLARR